MAHGGRSQVKMSDQSFDLLCTDCAEHGKTVEAVKYCVECGGYCCQLCVDAHQRLRAMRNHNLEDVSQGHQAAGQKPSLLEIPTERCCIHKGKIVDMYCGVHDDVGCTVCFFQDHKSCDANQVHSIPDMIDAIFNMPECKQTQQLLKDMIVSLDTASKSKDTLLQTLKKSKKETLGQVDTFEKALEAMLRKAANATRQKVETVYKKLETKILQDKHKVEDIGQDLKSIDDKLNKSEGNRAQRLACTKIGRRKLEDANNEMMKQLQIGTDVQLSFKPDQSLREYITALQGIGLVEHIPKDLQQRQQGIRQKQTQADSQPAKQHPNIYKIKKSKDITIKVAGDSYTCSSYGSCLTEDNHLLVTDYENRKLKRIGLQRLSIVDYCTLDSEPCGVCCISTHEAAVACLRDNKIQFVSIQNKMRLTRQIKMSHPCYGIGFKNNKLYVTDNSKSLYIYDINGSLLNTISRDNTGKYLFNHCRHITFNECGTRMYIGGWDSVVILDGSGSYISSMKDTDVKGVVGVAVDGKGNMFVAGRMSHKVVQYSEDGKKIGVVVKSGDGLQSPESVSFHPGLGYMFVTMYSSNVVKMYEVE